MRNRSLLLLMEQLVMLLVFAVTAAICLQVFVRADALSRENELRSLALFEAQNAAELLKSCKSVDEAAQQLNAMPEQDGFSFYLDAAGEPCGTDLAALVIVVQAEAPGRALVTAVLPEGQEAFIMLPVVWQEGV